MRRFCSELCRKRAEKARARFRKDPDYEAKRARKEAAFIARMKEVLAETVERQKTEPFGRPRLELAERVEMNSVPEPNTGCRLWTGALWGKYGRIKVDRVRRKAHQVAFEAHKGLVPPGRIVCHSCGVSLCVEPSHLYAGTHQDNFDDMKRHGRWKPPPSRAKVV